MKHHIQRTALSDARRRRIRGALVALGLIVSACGGSDDATSAAAAAPTEAPEVVPTEVPEDTRAVVPAEASDVESVTITAEESAESERAVAGLTSGEVSGACSYVFVKQIEAGAVVDQSCRISPKNLSALPDEFAQRFIEFVAVEGTETPAGGAAVIAGGSDEGFIFAGTALRDAGRIIGVTRGVREFEGSTAHMFVFAGPDGRFTMDWFVGDEVPFDPVAEGTIAMVGFECTLADGSESCTYEGADDRFVPVDDERTLGTLVPDDLASPVDGVSIFTSAARDGAFRAGLDDENGLRRFTGLREGTGEFEGGLIAEEGWGRLDGNTFIGTMRLSVFFD